MPIRAYGKSVASYTAWASLTEYVLTNKRVPTTDDTFCYEVTQAGTSGVTEPTWSNIVDATVADGTVIWTCREKDEEANPLSVTLDLKNMGHYSLQDIWVKSDSEDEVVFTVYGSHDGENFRQIDEIKVPHADRNDRHRSIQTSYVYIKVITEAEAVNEIEIVAGES